MNILLRAALFGLGAASVVLVFGSAIRTVILPRGVPAKLSRWVMLTTRTLFGLRLGPKTGYEKRDRVMALYGPVGLMAMLLAWLLITLAGFALMFWALEPASLRAAIALSGSSLLTLGFAPVITSAQMALAFAEAATGLVLLALLITYLPSIYSAFSRREQEVAKLEVRAGSPPNAKDMIQRAWRLQRMERLTDVWTAWEDWFADVEESHTSLPVLVFFRSPQPDQHWVVAAGAVLDSASVMSSSVDVARNVEAELCIRAGYVSLRRIASFFGIPFDPDPSPTDPISVTRKEFEELYRELESSGIPMKDPAAAWESFQGWRVNYDVVLRALAALTLAPAAPWSSDPAHQYRFPFHGAPGGIRLSSRALRRPDR